MLPTGLAVEVVVGTDFEVVVVVGTAFVVETEVVVTLTVVDEDVADWVEELELLEVAHLPLAL